MAGFVHLTEPLYFALLREATITVLIFIYFIIDSGFRISGFRQTQKETSRYLADKILFNASLICQISTIIEFYLRFERLVCKMPCGNLPCIHFLKQQKYGNKQLTYITVNLTESKEIHV